MAMREMESRGITKYWRVRSESLTSGGISSEDWNRHIVHSVSVPSYLVAFLFIAIGYTFQTRLPNNLHRPGIDLHFQNENEDILWKVAALTCDRLIAMR